MFLVIFLLDGATSLCLLDGAAHGIRHVVRVHDDMAVGVSGGTANSLDQRGLGPQEALLVGVDNGDQGDLGYVQALPQKVDSDQNVKDVQAHVADDLGPFEGIYVRVEVFDPDPGLGQVVGQILRHFFGQGGDQHLVVSVSLLADLADQVVDLSFHGAHVDFRIQKARGADDLLGAQKLVLLLIGAGGGGDKQHLVYMSLEFRELQRAVVQRGGQTEAVAHQGLLAGAVSPVHSPDLGNGHVGLIDNNQKIIVIEVHEGHGRFALLHEIQMAGVVFNAGAEAGLPHHLDVKIGSLGDPLGLEQHVFSLEIFHALPQFLLNVVAGGVDLFLRDDVVGGGIDHHVFELSMDAAGQLVHLADTVDLIAEPLYAEDEIAPLGGEDLQRVAADPEITALQGHVVAGVLDRHKLLQDFVPVFFHAGAEGDGHSLEFVGAAQAIDAGDGGDDNDIPSLRQRGRRGQAQLVDLVVDHGVLGNIGVALGNVGLRLVVIVVTDKILDCILRKKLLHLAVELAGQCLVVGNDQRGLVERLNDIGHCKSLAGSCHAQQGLKLISFFKSFYQFLDRFGLVAGRRIF